MELGLGKLQRGPPPQYYPSQTMLNFAEQTGCGALIVVWSFLSKLAPVHIYNQLHTFLFLFFLFFYHVLFHTTTTTIRTHYTNTHTDNILSSTTIQNNNTSMQIYLHTPKHTQTYRQSTLPLHLHLQPSSHLSITSIHLHSLPTTYITLHIAHCTL